MQELASRVSAEPFNVVATAIFLLAVLHTFFAARFLQLSRRVQERHDRRSDEAGRPRMPSVAAELLRG